MSLTAKAAWIIERNSDRNLDADEIARAAGVSKFHLAHAFVQSSGMPLMTYLRGRRLTKAAQTLASGASDLLDVALASGYGSHEAFTRAFRAMFDVTPDEVRKRGTTQGLPLIHPLPSQIEGSIALATPRIVDAREVRAVGMTRTYRVAEIAGIAAQWQAFMALAGEVEYRLPVIPLSIVASADAGDGFTYTSAVEVSAFGGYPKACSRHRLPAARYAVFTHGGHITTLGQTYEAIWNKGLSDSGLEPVEAASLERHCPTFDPRTGTGGVEIWIPVKP